MLERFSWREAEAAIGVSVGALRNLVDGKTPQEETLERLEEWARRQGHIPPDADEQRPRKPPGLTEQIAEIQASDASDLVKTARMLDLWALQRQRMMNELAEALREDGRILELRAEALRDAWRTARLEAEQAAARREELRSDRVEDIPAGRAPREAFRGIEVPLEEPAETKE